MVVESEDTVVLDELTPKAQAPMSMNPEVRGRA